MPTERQATWNGLQPDADGSMANWNGLQQDVGGLMATWNGLQQDVGGSREIWNAFCAETRTWNASCGSKGEIWNA
jgi:hypothetical protein